MSTLPRFSILTKKLGNYVSSSSMWLKRIGIGIAIIVFLLGLSIATWELVTLDRIYPGVTVVGYDVGRIGRSEAASRLQQSFKKAEETPIVLNANDRAWAVNPRAIDLRFDATATAKRAYQVGRTGNLLKDTKTKWQTVIRGFSVRPVYTYNKAVLNQKVEEIMAALAVPAQSSHIEYVENQFVVTPSLEGIVVDKAKLVKDIHATFANLSSKPISIPVTVEKPALTADQAQQILPALSQYAQEPLTLSYEDKKLTLDMQSLLALIDYEKASMRGFFISEKKVSAYIDEFAKGVDRPPRDALFKFEEGRVVTFAASQDGIEVDRQVLAQTLTRVLMESGSLRVIDVPVKKSLAKVATEHVNDLGIKELLATGESNFSGSPADRIYNIALAASRITGVLIAPGQEFSFNNAIGDISAATGYKQALVILSGRTVLGDGGGVCQVSTTVFRAALSAGLPITTRTAHAFRVGYYEREAGSWSGPGFDATIYQPGVDFKFKNDTPSHILLQTRVDKASSKLYIDLYGTSDGRQAVVSKAKIHSTTPPPPESRIDDQNLPKGQVKQMEKAVPGAKTSFTRTVTRNGETIISETFHSNFRAWQAVFMVGTKEG